MTRSLLWRCFDSENLISNLPMTRSLLWRHFNFQIILKLHISFSSLFDESQNDSQQLINILRQHYQPRHDVARRNQCIIQQKQTTRKAPAHWHHSQHCILFLFMVHRILFWLNHFTLHIRNRPRARTTQPIDSPKQSIFVVHFGKCLSALIHPFPVPPTSSSIMPSHSTTPHKPPSTMKNTQKYLRSTLVVPSIHIHTLQVAEHLSKRGVRQQECSYGECVWNAGEGQY